MADANFDDVFFCKSIIAKDTKQHRDSTSTNPTKLFPLFTSIENGLSKEQFNSFEQQDAINFNI